MAREQDVHAAVAAMSTAVSAAVDEIKTATQNILDALKAQTSTGVDPDAVEAAANTINSACREAQRRRVLSTACANAGTCFHWC